MEKCSAKLCKVAPWLKIQRMTMKQVDEKKRKLKIIVRQNVAKHVIHSQRGTSYTKNFADAEFEPGIVKLESQTLDHPNPIFRTDNNENPYSDYSDNLATEGLEGSTNDSNHDDAGQIEETVHVSFDPGESSSKASSSCPQRRPAERKYTRNTITGKYKCMSCSLEFNSNQAFYYHYDSIHLKAKFKCNLCGKEFTQRPSFQRHHKSVHMGVRYKCLGCNKECSYRSDLLKHQRKFGCGVGISK